MKSFNYFFYAVLLCSSLSFGQSTDAGITGNDWGLTKFIGWNASNGANPLFFRTNNQNRLTINGATGITSGFVGIGNTNPQFRLHVDGDQVATGAGWTRAIMISNDGALMWNGSPTTNRHYFMAHSSNNPAGDFYQGYSIGYGAGTTVNYASKVYVASSFAGPDASTHIFKWLVVEEPEFER